jgi:hypothetical protein
MNVNALISGTAALQHLDGVAGVMLFRRRHLVHVQMPFTRGRSVDLMDVVQEMLGGYRDVNRKMRQIYLEFDSGHLLIQLQGEAVLMLLLTGRADADLVASAGSVLLQDHEAVLEGLSDETPASSLGAVEELVVTNPGRVREMTEKAAIQAFGNWGQLRQAMEGLLGKVMGRAQASNLIDRILREKGIDDPYRLTASQAREVSTAVVECIPNVAKRRQLMMEFDIHLKDLKI